MRRAHIAGFGLAWRWVVVAMVCGCLTKPNPHYDPAAGSGGEDGSGLDTATGTSADTVTTTTTTTTSSSTTTTTTVGTTGPPPEDCADPDRNDNAYVEGTRVGPVSCGTDFASFTAALQVADTVDWYELRVNGDCPANVSPFLSFSVSGDLGVCAYVRCADTGTPLAVSCGGNTSGNTLMNGLDGCCGIGELEVGVLCRLQDPTDTHELEVWFDIGRASADMCMPYGVSVVSSPM